MYWFTIKYWKYLLTKPFNLTKFFCRVRQHSCGVFWYNPHGHEPDMHCKNCNDDLG